MAVAYGPVRLVVYDGLILKGLIPTRPETIDAMVELLFRERSPGLCDCVLDPGCGTGAFRDDVPAVAARGA